MSPSRAKIGRKAFPLDFASSCLPCTEDLLGFDDPIVTTRACTSPSTPAERAAPGGIAILTPKPDPHRTVFLHESLVGSNCVYRKIKFERIGGEAHPIGSVIRSSRSGQQHARWARNGFTRRVRLVETKGCRLERRGSSRDGDSRAGRTLGARRGCCFGQALPSDDRLALSRKPSLPRNLRR